MIHKGKKSGLFRGLKIAYYRSISNRRRYLRVPLRVKVTNRLTDFFEFHSSTNISVGGMFLRSESPYAVDARLKLEFTLPGDKQPIYAEGTVVRVVHPGNEENIDPGMGVKFTQIDQDHIKSIERFVEKSGLS